MLASSSSLSRVGTAALVSMALVLPLLILELTNRGAGGAEFPIVLFAVLWLLPFAFVLLTHSILESRNRTRTRTYWRPLAVICLVCIAWFWAVTVIDQMPCFLGVPNCD